MVKVRMNRQEVLNASLTPSNFIAVIDEAVMRRQVGGEGVMRRQVKHLAEIASRKNVALEVVRFRHGGHPGMLGPFVIFEFPDAEADDVSSWKPGGDLIHQGRTGQIANHEERLDALRKLSSGRKGFLALLEGVAAGDE